RWSRRRPAASARPISREAATSGGGDGPPPACRPPGPGCRSGAGRPRCQAHRDRSTGPQGVEPARAHQAARTTGRIGRAGADGRRKLAALARTRRDRAPTRLADYLLRRGYPAAVVSRVVKVLLAVNLDAGATGSSHDGSV